MVFLFLKRWQYKCTLLRVRICRWNYMQLKLDLTVGSLRQAGYLANVYPTSTSMQLAWVADPFLSDFQKRSPQSFALPTEHISYVRCTYVFTVVSYARVDFWLRVRGYLGSVGPKGPDPRPWVIVSGLCIRFVLCVSIHLIDCNDSLFSFGS